MIGSGHQQAPLGQLLVEMGAVAADDMDQAIAESKKSGERLGQILLKMSLVDEEVLMQALGRQLGAPYVRISEQDVDPELIRGIPAKLVNHYKFFPLLRDNGLLRIAGNDPLDMRMLDDLRLMLKTEIEMAVASRKEIREGIKKYYGIGAETMEGLMEEEVNSGEVKKVDPSNIDEMAEDASIVRFVNQVILEAFGDRATDIHFEPMEDDLRIRYRIDGMLYEAAIPQSVRRFQSAILSRIKIMADMNIAERRLPQDGKIKIKSADKDFDLRVSTVPTPYGESISVRILYRDSDFINLERLGFSPFHLRILRNMIRKPHGIILVTGPTGSGKSTTLYAALREINDISKKIITIEDPIEYRMAGVTQIQVNPGIGLTFARCLRTILRQDPDIILVGETRDSETADITIRTALTGHLVFSTLHTNDACGAVTRLLDMGVEPFLVSSSIEGMIAQRLVRLLCPQCKTPFQPTAQQTRFVNVTNDDAGALTLYRARGCESCRYTGFRGRTAIYEMVPINETLRRLIVDRAPANELKAEAIRNGMRPMRHDGWSKIKAGLTTIDEVMRVTLEDDVMADEEGLPVQEPGSDSVPAAE